MWKQLLEVTAKLFSLSKDVQQNKTDIKAVEQDVKDLQRDFNQLRQEVRDLARGFDRLAYEIRRVSDNEAQERKMMALQLENELLKFERRLPSPQKPHERGKLKPGDAVCPDAGLQ